MHTCSVHVAISGLGQVLVGFHLLKDSGEHLFDSGLAVPVSEERELARLNGSIVLVNRRDVNLGSELSSHGDIRVLRSACDSDEVDSVVELSVGRSNDGTVPVSERLIGSVIESE